MNPEPVVTVAQLWALVIVATIVMAGMTVGAVVSAVREYRARRW